MPQEAEVFDPYRLFLSLFREWAQSYHCFTRSYLAIYQNENWYLRFGRTIFLRSRPTENEEREFNFSLRTSHVRAGRFVQKFDPNAADAAALDIDSNPGAVQVEDGKLCINGKMSRGGSPYVNLYEHHRFRGPERWAHLRWSHVAGHELQALTVPNFLDDELYSATTPFAGLIDLLNFLDMPADAADHSMLSNCEWVIAAPAAFHASTSLSDGRLQIQLDAPQSVNRDDLEIGARIIKGLQIVDRRTLSMSNARGDGATDLKATFEYPGAAHADLFLKYKSKFVGRRLVSDSRLSSNYRYSIYKAFNPTRSFSEAYARNEKDNFEQVIALGMELMGWSVLHFGRLAGHDDNPDLVCISDRNHIILLECTVGDIDHKGKLLKLKLRFDEFKKHVERTLIPVLDIACVVVTPLSRESTAHHHERAAAFGISVLGREQLEEIGQALERPVNPGEFLAYIRRYIPSETNPAS